MLRSIRSSLTYANVVASLALFIALGGVGYAAVKLPKNSVGASQIRKDAVTGAKVRDKSLTPADFKGSVQGPAGPAGPAGAQGAPGPQGPAGATGPAGTARAYGFVKSDGTILAAKSKNLTSSKVGTGVYCVTPTPASGIDARAVLPIATTDYNDGNGSYHLIQSVGGAVSTAPNDCPGGWEFVTDDVDGTPTREDIGFAVVVP